MESALAWVGQLAEYIAQLFPHFMIVHVWERAVRLRRGRNPLVIEPGIMWWWPVMTSMVVHPVARQTHTLKSQTITTRDGKIIVVGGLIVFDVKDVVKLVVETHDPDIAVTDMSLSAVHDVCCLLTWEELQEQQRSGELERKLKASAKTELDKYGVRVLKMTLTDLSPTKVLKLLQSHDM